MLSFAPYVSLEGSREMNSHWSAHDHNAYFIGRASTEISVVNIIDGDVTFTFPRNFLTSFGPPAENGAPPYIEGMAMMPLFEGATSDNIECFEASRLSECGTVRFVYNGRRVWNDQDFFSQRNLLLGGTDKVIHWNYGLVKAYRPNSYLYIDDDKKMIIPISCNFDTSICQMYFTSNGFAWRFLMHSKLLPRWSDVISRFENFLANHIR
jgi:hypothetical protein